MTPERPRMRVVTPHSGADWQPPDQVHGRELSLGAALETSIEQETIARALHRAAVRMLQSPDEAVVAFDDLPAEAQARLRRAAEVAIRRLDPARHATACMLAAPGRRAFAVQLCLYERYLLQPVHPLTTGARPDGLPHRHDPR